ncbi:MAG: hypothetical protein ACHREM_24275 [Polyangiales bacterium]
MPLETSDRRTRWLVVGWAIAAFAFARSRVPFDDEWFSLTLARDTTWARMWTSIARDVHPPWVALIDRASIAIGGEATLTLAHVAASALAIALISRAVRDLGGRGWTTAVAALHPIVFMYGGACRWYAFAFLADALRLFAIARAWSRPSGARLDRATRIAFAAGALLGPMSAYVEAPRIAIDALAWLWLERRRGATSEAARAIAFATPWPIVALFAFPFARAQLALAGPVAASTHGGIALFLGLGPLGEAHLPPPWTALAIVAVPGLVVVVARAWRARRPLLVASLGSLAAWAICAPLGVWHPRYALAAWCLIATLVVEIAIDLWPSTSKLARASVFATAAYLALALLLTLGQRSFLKGDLDAIGASACAPVFGDKSDLVVVPYPRARDLLVRACAPSESPRTSGWIRHYDRGDDALFADWIAPLVRARSVTLVTVPTGGSSLTETQRRARALVAARCRSTRVDRTVEDPFASLKPWASRSSGVFRLEIERFSCP